MSVYYYSEFEKFNISIFTKNETDIQLPPLKFIDDIEIKNGDGEDEEIENLVDNLNDIVYIHTLKSAKIFSSVEGDNDSHYGWDYTYNMSENDFLYHCLTHIRDKPNENDEFDMFSILDNDKKLDFKSLVFGYSNYVYDDYNKDKFIDTRFVIPALHGPFYDPITDKHYHPPVDGYNYPNLDNKQNSEFDILKNKVIPGLMFKFKNNIFVGCIVNPLLDENLYDLRKAYVDNLLDMFGTDINFDNFYKFIINFSNEFSHLPTILDYKKIDNFDIFIKEKIKFGLKPTTDINLDNKIILEYLHSEWPEMEFDKAVNNQYSEFINIDQLKKDNYVERDFKTELQTLYISDIASVFDTSLETYKKLHDDENLIVVVPHILFKTLKNNVIKLWMKLGEIK